VLLELLGPLEPLGQLVQLVTRGLLVIWVLLVSVDGLVPLEQQGQQEQQVILDLQGPLEQLE